MRSRLGNEGGGGWRIEGRGRREGGEQREKGMKKGRKVFGLIVVLPLLLGGLAVEERSGLEYLLR